jgi:hypothetical protein
MVVPFVITAVCPAPTYTVALAFPPDDTLRIFTPLNVTLAVEPEVQALINSFASTGAV